MLSGPVDLGVVAADDGPVGALVAVGSRRALARGGVFAAKLLDGCVVDFGEGVAERLEPGLLVALGLEAVKWGAWVLVRGDVYAWG